MKIGVVGIGKMGRPIAERLLDAGHEVSIFNRSQSVRVSALRDRGAAVRSSAAEVVANADIILTALPTEESVRGVYADMVKVARAGQLYIDHSTVSIALNRWCAHELRARQAFFMDAPVSGGPAGAESGKLTVMVGGDADSFERALPIFQQLGPNVRLCGPVGAGQAIKLTNQLLVAVHTAAVAEAAAFAIRLGADLSTVEDVIGTSFGSSAMLLRDLPRFRARDFEPATPVSLISKDLGIIHAEAQAAGVPLPLGGLTEQCFVAARAHGWGEEDMSALFKLWDSTTGSHPSSSA
ncbi:MAG: NAD(P)-dependent oxidoreductase [Candidatus Dormiibacterota bacterium]